MKTALVTTAFLSVLTAIILWHSGAKSLALFLAVWAPTIVLLPLVLVGSTGTAPARTATAPAYSRRIRSYRR